MNKKQLYLVLFWSIFLLFGCQKWSEPVFRVDEWEPPEGTQPNQFWTIGPNESGRRSVLGAHPVMSTPPDSITTLKTPIYVRAVVVSSDEGGNYYKSMVIQDHTGGVELQLDMNGLYNFYPVGQKIVLVCNGLVVGDYNNLPQVGWIYQETQVGRINSLFFDRYIIKDGMPSPNNLPKVLTNTANEESERIDFSSQRDINKLVRLENVTFDENAIGKPFAFNDFSTDWVVSVPLVNGARQAVTVRTSNYAKFRSMTIQKKEYNLTGILTTYRNTYQLMIRTKEDIEPPKPDESLEFDFTKNPVEEGGWSIQPATGNITWIYRPTSQLMLHPGNQSQNTAIDNWFVSPVITYPDLANGYLCFEHQLFVQNSEYAPYQVYYTTSTDTPFNPNEWKLLGELKSFPAVFEWSNRFPLSNINSNTFKIAFRYNAPDPAVETYRWEIRKVEIRNK